ncbi:efflux RND transporter periplasmic adaptor subunit [Oceanobacter mangrovi]|uniref:efflux RND transporter periplasmic adaptor subunit n=1 Tax=Oceanobacter mangrovi TaxID=2862510 RepID=UPI001C8E8FDB|nr:efflux RND transporter periplasmic adaptor subunit [Oceanobacter mangrovi]
MECPRQINRWIRLILAGLMVGSISQLSLAAATESAIRQTPVSLVKVQSRSMALPIRVTGQTVALEQLLLGFRIGGLIQQLNGDVGQRVSKGQLLAQLDSLEADAAVQQAQAQLDDVIRQRQRLSRLQGNDAVSIQALQGVETQETLARENLRIAEFNRKHSRILAPADGWILARNVEAGQWVQSGQTIFVMAPADPGFGVRLLLTDQQRQAVSMGDTASVVLNPNTPNEVTLKAHVRELSLMATSSLFPAELAFDDLSAAQQRQLIAGLTVRVEITPATKARLTSIPAAALVAANGRHGQVMVASRGDGGWTAEQRTVEIERLSAGSVWIRAGLEDEPFLVSRGAELIEAGDLLRPIAADEVH